MVGGMKLCELNSFPPNLLSNPTTLYHPVCDIAKSGGFQKRKKAGGVGWSARVRQPEEGGPRAPEKVRWVADRSFKQNEWSGTRMEKDVKVR